MKQTYVRINAMRKSFWLQPPPFVFSFVGQHADRQESINTKTKAGSATINIFSFYFPGLS